MWDNIPTTETVANRLWITLRGKTDSDIWLPWCRLESTPAWRQHIQTSLDLMTILNMTADIVTAAAVATKGADTTHYTISSLLVI